MLTIFLSAMVLIGCTTATHISRLDLSGLYNPAHNLINPWYDIYHPDTETSIVSVFIHNKELLYERDARNDYFISSFNVKIKVYDSFSSLKPILNSRMTFVDTMLVDDSRMISRELAFPLAIGEDYILHLIFEDLPRRTQHETIRRVEKRNLYEPGFFNVQDGNQALSQPFFVSGENAVNFFHYPRKDLRVDISRYSSSFKIPAAAYVEQDESAETLAMPVAEMVVPLRFSEGKAAFRLPGNGFYRVTEPGKPENGFSVINFWNGYPFTITDEMMLLPLRYLTSAEEFRVLSENQDPRQAALRFWTRITGNPDRGTVVMQRFTERVAQANQLFTSFVPGWQTDMGMIFIIYGPPERVFMGNNFQVWHYSGSINTVASQFRFEKAENDFTGNHYILQRNQNHRQSWNQAVERWRR
jgi:GWxTD domain-containing protein